MALTLDPSKRNDIIIRQGQSLNFSFLLTNESDGEDFPVAGYTFNLKIYDRRRTLLFDLTDGDGLTVQDGSVAVSISDNDLDIPDGDYKYFLWVTNPSNQMTTWINGYAKVKDSLSVGSQDDVSVTVSDADNNVNITISISGSTLSAGPVTDQWSSELLFDNNYKVREKVMDGDIVYTKAESGNTPNSFIEDYVTGDGIHTITFDQSWYNGNGGVFDNSKINAIIFYYDLHGRIRYTIENLEDIGSIIQLSTPQNPFASSGGQDTINTGCDPVNNASAYAVYVSDTGELGSFSVLATGLETPSYQDTGLSLGQTRYYQWQALGDGTNFSNSNFTSTVNATTTSSTQLQAPVLSEITNVDSITNQLDWTNVTGESGYQIDRRVTGESEWTTLTTTTSNITTYGDNTAIPGTAYDYSVIAKGDGGSVEDSPRSNVQQTITNDILTPKLSLVIGEGNITLYIDNIDPNATITLTRDTNSDYSTEVNVEEYVSPNATVLDENITNGTLYFYRARASVNGVNSEYAKEVASLIHVDAGKSTDFSTLSGKISQINLSDHTFSQGTDSQRPTLSDSKIIFVAADRQYVECSSNIEMFKWQPSDDFSFYIKGIERASVDSGVVISLRGQHGSNNNGWNIGFTATDLFIAMNDGITSNIGTFAWSDVDTPIDLIIMHESGLFSIYNSSNIKVSSDSPTVINAVDYTGINLLLGARTNPASAAHCFNGAFVEIMAFDKALDSQERSALLSW